MSTVVPLSQVQRRLPQAGRIRLGEKVKNPNPKKKDRPASIGVFRFTSGDRDLLVPLAEVYGGEIKPWNEPKSGDRFQLYSEATKISVVLPPNPMTEWFELWSGEKGLERRCDGDTCTVTQNAGGPDGPEYVDMPCICERRGVLECKYKLRLSVLLPEVQSLGTWRLDTSGDNAQKEIPGVVELIQQLQPRGLTKATLRIEHRTAPRKRFIVPVLDPGVSIDALEAGIARVDALGSASAATPPIGELAQGEERAGGVPPPPAPSPNDYECGPGRPCPDRAHDHWPGDDIVDAEVVDDPTITSAWIETRPTKDKNRLLLRARQLSEEAGLPAPTTAAAIDERVLAALAREEHP